MIGMQVLVSHWFETFHTGENRIKNKFKMNLRLISKKKKKKEKLNIMKRDNNVSWHRGPVHAPLTYLTGDTY